MRTKQILITLSVIISLFLVNQVILAWTAPSATPPSGNAAAPVNIGSTSQYKSGALGVGGVFRGYAGATFDASVSAPSFLYTSDRNLKKNIQIIPDALDKVLKLEGISFQWKDSERKDLGLIAQDVEKVLPELVTTNSETGLKSVEYGNLTAVLIEALKEQQKQINELKNEIENLKK